MLSALLAGARPALDESMEIFFAADDDLPRKAELVFAVFDNLRARGIPLAAYVSLRFLAPSKSLLATAAFEPISCAIEISMLRGGRGNDEALAALQGIAIQNNGRIHWGQQNDLSARGVAAMNGERYVSWCRSLEAVEGTSPTFSNLFTKSHGLEPTPFAPPTRVLDVHVDPRVIPLGVAVTVTVRAEDSQSGAPVDGTVTIVNFVDGIPETSEHSTNTPFTLTFEAVREFDLDLHDVWIERPYGSVAAEGYDPRTVPFRFA